MASDDDNGIREKILLATLPHVAFDGWVDRALKLGAEDAGFDADMARREFPGGAAEMIRFWADHGDRQMLERMGEGDAAALSFAERMKAAIRLRIEINSDYREAVRRTLSYLALPQNAGLGARCTLETVSAIWYAVGDTSTDFTYYTKRATLTPVYAATILYWIDDTSEGSAATWSFLDRQIENVMVVPRLQNRLRGALGAVTSPLTMRPRLSKRPTMRSRPV